MKHCTLERFKRLFEVGHETEFIYHGIRYGTSDEGDSIWLNDKQYRFEGLSHAEMVEAFVKTPVFPDGKSIEQGEADIDVMVTTNCLDDE